MSLLLIVLFGLQEVTSNTPPAVVAAQELQAARRGKIAPGMSAQQQRKVGKSGTVYYRFQSKTTKRNTVAQLKYELEVEWAKEQMYSGHEVAMPTKPKMKKPFSWVPIPPPPVG